MLAWIVRRHRFLSGPCSFPKQLACAYVSNWSMPRVAGEKKRSTIFFCLIFFEPAHRTSRLPKALVKPMGISTAIRSAFCTAFRQFSSNLQPGDPHACRCGGRTLFWPQATRPCSHQSHLCLTKCRMGKILLTNFAPLCFHDPLYSGPEWFLSTPV